MRRQAIPAQVRVLEDLGIDAGYAIFGHVHRLGPVPGEDPAQWGSHPAILNTGSWQFEALLAARGEPPHPYWPGGAVLIAGDHPPHTLGLLDDLRREDLDPGTPSGPGRDPEDRRRRDSVGSSRRPPDARGERASYRWRDMPKLFWWAQALIVVFVVAGIVIAVTRLA